MMTSAGERFCTIAGNAALISWLLLACSTESGLLAADAAACMSFKAESVMGLFGSARTTMSATLGINSNSSRAALAPAQR
jgi:hypothetical protein